MLNIKSYEEKNGEWIIVTDKGITINPHVAKEAGRALTQMLNAAEEVSLECLVSTLNGFREMRECAEYLTKLSNEGTDTDGDYLFVLTNVFIG